jgi:hypothetical protein
MTSTTSPASKIRLNVNNNRNKYSTATSHQINDKNEIKYTSKDLKLNLK